MSPFASGSRAGVARAAKVAAFGVASCVAAWLAACGGPPESAAPAHARAQHSSVEGGPELGAGEPSAEVGSTASPTPRVETATVPSASSSTSAPAAGASARALPTRPLPEEPFYKNNPEHTEECLQPPAQAPSPAFPSPFERCEAQEISYSTPPPGPHLHFHYRSFSAELTTLRRKLEPGVCCYMTWAFPR